MNRHCIAALTLALIASACHSAPPGPVPLAGNPASWSNLAGEWAGAYESAQSGRSGSIVFTLIAGEDHAHGDVLMIPRAPKAPGNSHEAMARETAAPARPLSITFVRARGDSVSGSLDPYTDPDCGCTVHTTFTGVLERNAIAGVYVTHVPGRRPLIGSWSVGRRRN